MSTAKRPPPGVLRSERDGADIRHLGVRVNSTGALIVEGQDLGPAVEAFWGNGMTEYEWSYTVAAEHVPRVVGLLGGGPQSDVVELLVARFAGHDADGKLRSWLSEHDIPTEFWSRVGD